MDLVTRKKDGKRIIGEHLKRIRERWKNRNEGSVCVRIYQLTLLPSVSPYNGRVPLDQFTGIFRPPINDIIDQLSFRTCMQYHHVPGWQPIFPFSSGSSRQDLAKIGASAIISRLRRNEDWLLLLISANMRANQFLAKIKKGDKRRDQLDSCPFFYAPYLYYSHSIPMVECLPIILLHAHNLSRSANNIQRKRLGLCGLDPFSHHHLVRTHVRTTRPVVAIHSVCVSVHEQGIKLFHLIPNNWHKETPDQIIEKIRYTFLSTIYFFFFYCCLRSIGAYESKKR